MTFSNTCSTTSSQAYTSASLHATCIELHISSSSYHSSASCNGAAILDEVLACIKACISGIHIPSYRNIFSSSQIYIICCINSSYSNAFAIVSNINGATNCSPFSSSNSQCLFISVITVDNFNVATNISNGHTLQNIICTIQYNIALICAQAQRTCTKTIVTSAFNNTICPSSATSNSKSSSTSSSQATTLQINLVTCTESGVICCNCSAIMN